MNSNHPIRNIKSGTLGLALAAVLIPAALASANPGRAHGIPANVSGHVEVVHQVPGGTVTVGAEWGRQPRPAPQVVVVQSQPQVVVVERGNHCHRRDREVTIIHERPSRQVTVIREQPARREVVVVENHGDAACGRPEVIREERRSGDSHYYNDGKQVSIDRNGQDGQYHYYKDVNQVSETKVTQNGTYHYYEDANQVSIQDNRDGRERNVYVRK
ncbi:MAG: hypothetical protein ABI036_04355 [Fibrobacteria bacterium]